MKKAAFLLWIVCCTTAAVQAQITVKPVTKRKVMADSVPVPVRATGIPPAPANGTPATSTGTPPPPGSNVPPPPPPAKNTPPPPPPTSVYSLTGAVVRVRTGTDNKENLSAVYLGVYNNATDKLCMMQATPITTLFDVNSEMEFRLVKYTTYDVTASLLLSSLQQKGINLEVNYFPNFLTDAWKIQGLTLTLEIKDQFGNPHPQLNNKVIPINNAVGFLDNGNKTMSCFLDAHFNVLNARVSSGHQPFK